MIGKLAVGVVVATSWAIGVHAEDLCPKYGECADAKHFVCHDTSEDAVVKRVCYDEKDSYLIVQLKSTYYGYCAVDATTTKEFLSATPMEDFYRNKIKASGNKGQFDCRTHPAPKLD